MQNKFTIFYPNSIKRIIDIILSLFGLFVFFPILLFAWIISSIETKSNGIFIQERVGKDSIFFKIFKIKTMKVVDGSINDIRITKFGRYFRIYKIDELPQLWNVLIGDMSFVGPRPDVPGYADRLKGSDRKILSVRPGITGPAQLFYKNEEFLLNSHRDPTQYNDTIIWPNKVKINRKYVEGCSFSKDFYYIFKTLKVI
jgi:lipopolysaccharide/colanic/teichoic acid biosynthesis glycosyltransferase